jgi:hypothetical protein
MATVIERGKVATVGRGMQGEVTPSRLMITLYDLITTIQDNMVRPEDDALAVATVVHLLPSRRLAWRRSARAWRNEMLSEGSPAARYLSRC